ncbi:MAG: hypothetical protein ACXVZV_05705 [Terriglobales bacterium]
MRPHRFVNLLVAFFLFFTPHVLAGDLGHADVYAVCRITKRDGQTLESVIRIASGGYEKTLHANGFYYELNGKPYTVNLFSPAFRSIDFVKGEGVYDPEVLDRGTSFPADRGTLYYLRTVPTEHYFQNANEDQLKKAAGTAPGTIVIDRTITHHGLYVLSDYIPIYTSVVAYQNDIDMEMFAALPPEKRPKPSGKIQQPVKVPLAQLAKLELLTKPSPKWLSQIAENNKAINRRYENSDAEDWMLPVWFHEIQPGSESYDEYKNFRQWEY